MSEQQRSVAVAVAVASALAGPAALAALAVLQVAAATAAAVAAAAAAEVVVAAAAAAAVVVVVAAANTAIERAATKLKASVTTDVELDGAFPRRQLPMAQRSVLVDCYHMPHRCQGTLQTRAMPPAGAVPPAPGG